MYPTLSHLTKDLFGFGFVPIPTFGFFVALSFIAAAWCFTRELKRKEEEGFILPGLIKVTKGAPANVSDLIMSGIFGFVLGFKLGHIVGNFPEFMADPRAVILSTKGNWFAGILGTALAVYNTYREKQKTRLPEPVTEDAVLHPYELVSNMTIVAAISGIIGARVFHILENWIDFLKDPADMIFSTGGFTFYGGLIFGAIAVIYYARQYRIPTLHLIDACAPGLMLAYGVGRIGCQMSGDGDWGIDNLAAKPSWMNSLPDWMWSYNYPNNVVGDGAPIPGCEGHYCNALVNPVYPTPLYEAVMGILLFFFLWSIRKKIKAPGVLFCIYLIVNGIERFFIEKIRVNTLYEIFGHGITQAEIISCMMVLLGIIGIMILNKKKPEIASL